MGFKGAPFNLVSLHFLLFGLLPDNGKSRGVLTKKKGFKKKMIK